MKSDIVRWNEKYSNHQYSDSITPDPILTDNRPYLTGRGKSLDLGCGVCDNALHLAAIGFDSYAVDGSETALRFGKRKAQANSLELLCFVADLDFYPLPEQYFDAIVVIRYLNRNLIDPIKRALKIDGILLLQTFNIRFLEEKPGFPESYVLQDGELTTWFNDWDCIDSNDSATNQQADSYWVGYKVNHR